MKSRGFTLIEIIVSLAIFSVVAIIAIGALVRVTSANRQAQAIQAGVNNVSFIMDSISRELRTGTTYSCNKDVTISNLASGITGNPCGGLSTDNSGTLIQFTSANTIPNGTSLYNLRYAYLFIRPSGSNSTTTIYKAQETSPNQGFTGPGSATFYPILSSSVNITHYSVGVFGGTGTSYPYQWAFIRLKGHVGTQIKDQSVFDVQTSISERSDTNI